MNKKILHIDMDGVLFKNDGYIKSSKDIREIFDTQNFWKDLELMENAIESVKILQKHYDVYFLSGPSVRNPNSYTGKRLSIEKNFGFDMCERLILTKFKNLLIGDYLIDDQPNYNRAIEFKGEFIHFGKEPFENWEKITDYLKGLI